MADSFCITNINCFSISSKQEMIDLIQWRVTIGTWHCSSNNRKGSKREYDHGEVSHSVDEWWIGSLRLLQAILTVAVILSYSLVMILLLLCGDVEINPGPINIGEFCL